MGLEQNPPNCKTLSSNQMLLKQKGAKLVFLKWEASVFSLDQLKKELNKLFQPDFLQAEINRLKKELTELEAFKKIKEPTQAHLNQLEKQYHSFSKKILKKQSELDKEFNSALRALRKRRNEAESHIKDLQKLALDQKKSIEKLIRKQMKALGLASTSKKKKTQKKATKKTSEKKKTRKKSPSKKKTKS
jgi:chromosome segregation ATPase